MKEKANKKAITLNDSLAPIPTNITIQHVDSQSTLDEHINADSHVMTAQVALLMQVWPQLESIGAICDLSDQLMKVLKTRRELCLKPTSVVDMTDNEIDVTPV